MASTPASLSRTALDADSKSIVGVDVQVHKEAKEASSETHPSYRSLRFQMVFVSICVSVFLSALEFTSVSTALPTIVHDLQGQDFIWIPSAYVLASVALLPASGGFAELFGRRATMLGSQLLFALGSALCGSAQNMNWLIAARTVQGAGGGGIVALGSIIMSDLVPLQDRALYNSFIALTWAMAAAIGPLIGGALADSGNWRWLFYLNLPITGVASTLVISFLNLRVPQGNFMGKMARMDWIGNLLITASSTSVIIGLTWGGVQYAWSSANVLAPLILGLAGMAFFLFYEARVPKEPLVPWSILSKRESFSGYAQTLIAPIVMVSVLYFLPTYFQACKSASPTGSGVDILGLSLGLGPFLTLANISLKKTGKYRPQLWFGWALMILAMGILSLLTADSPRSQAVGLPVVFAIGIGTVYSLTYYPTLAPLSVSQNAHAVSFYIFCRTFAGVWGVTIGTSVLQTQLSNRLPAEFTSQFPEGVAIAFSAIPIIDQLPEPLRSEVRAAFADSISVIWKVMAGVAGIGLLASFLMEGLPLHTALDEKWGLEDAQRTSDDTQV